MAGLQAGPLPLLLSPDLLQEADRVLTICNACRYCEGVCPVFPALERREAFDEPDVLFLANLCHDCRACWYVCPYTPPHEFDLNLPAVMSRVRTEAYPRLSRPAVLSKAFGQGILGVATLALLLFAAISFLVAVLNPSAFGTGAAGPRSFYSVVPWLAMVVTATVMSLYGVVVGLAGAVRYWRLTRSTHREGGGAGTVLGAVADAALLRHLGGGGAGCYTDERPSGRRRRAHSLVFYGFLATFASTVIAAIQQEILGWQPPYPYLSAPVILGAAGGAMIIAGALDLLRLKRLAGDRLADERMTGLDLAFLVVLVALSVDGLLLLLLRETWLMPAVLSSHLALVGAFFVSAPYGKFVHFVYRFEALVQMRLEAQAEARADGAVETGKAA